MAKPAVKAAIAVATPMTPVAYSYRAERKDSFAWQGYKTTTFSDDSFKVEAFYKPDLLEIVMRKIQEAIKQEGQTEFLASKKKKEA